MIYSYDVSKAHSERCTTQMLKEKCLVTKRTHVFTSMLLGISQEYVWVEPKQFRYWLKKCGLFDTHAIHHKYLFGTLSDNWKGFGRHWRITASGRLEVSCQNKDFDRWANSTIGVDVDVTKIDSETKMREAISRMLKMARTIDP